jgi:putative inorganic carbon (HCO3(-)) transporter
MKKKLIKILDYLIELGLLTIVFFTPIIFAVFKENYNVFLLEKIILVRILVIFILFFSVAKIFLAWRVETLRRNVSTMPRLVFLFIILLFFSYLISSLFSLSPAESWLGSYDRQNGSFTLISALLFFVLLIFHLDNHDKLCLRHNSGRESFKFLDQKLKRLIFTVLWSSALVSVYGILQYLALDPLNWIEPAYLTGRISSTLGQPNFLGQYLLLVIPLGVYGFFLTRNFWPRFFVGLLNFSLLISLVLTASRACWLGLIAEGVMFLFFKFKKKINLFYILGIILIIITLFFIFPDSFLKQRAQSIFNLSEGSNKIRILFYQAAWDDFKSADLKRKIFGYGPDTLSLVFEKYYQKDWGIYENLNSWPDRAHNIFLDNLLQFGIFGCLVFFSFLGYVFYIGYTSLRRFLYPLAPFPPTSPRPLLNRRGELKVGKGVAEFSSFPLYGLGEGCRAKRWRGEEEPVLIAALAALAGYLVSNFFSFSLIVDQIYLYIILAIIIYGASRRSSLIIQPSNHPTAQLTDQRGDHPWPLLVKGGGGFIILILLFIIGVNLVYFYNIKFWLADYYFMRAVKSEINNKCSLTIGEAIKPLELTPDVDYYQKSFFNYGINCFDKLSAADKALFPAQMLFYIREMEKNNLNFTDRLSIARGKIFLGEKINPKFYQQARKDYEDLVKRNPYITLTYQDWADLEIKIKNYNQAVVILKQGVAVAPSPDNSHLNDDHRRSVENELNNFYSKLGDAYFEKKDWPTARGYFKQALRFNPYQVLLYKKIADTYYAEKNLDQAIWYTRRGMMLSPRDPFWPEAISLLYKESGDKIKERELTALAEELKSH